MILLGSTGSIGQNTLDIARRFSLPVTALCAHSNVELLNAQIREFKPKFAAIFDKAKAKDVRCEKVFVGNDGILQMIEEAAREDKLLVNALVGFAGLRPTLKACELGLKIALANKESLVAAGKFIDITKIVPIDSEHFGLWYLLNGRKPKRLIITASGGAFRDTPIEQLGGATLENALNHPNWKMGKKITIDSATMANKLFEILEARWLFGCEQIDALIEPKSLVHALVDFPDGSTTAHLAKTDMRLPIAFALKGECDEEILEHVDLAEVGSLEFRKIDTERYPLWQLKNALLEKPQLGVIVNAANDLSAQLFLDGKIGFTDISKFILSAFEKFEKTSLKGISDVFEADSAVREYGAEFFKKSKI